MFNKHRILLSLFVILSLVLVACGGNAEDDGDNGGSDSSVTLTQNTSTDEPITGGTLSADYPEGWFAQAAGGAIILADSEEALASQDAGPGENQVLTSISFLSTDMVSAMASDGELSPLAVLQVFSTEAGDEVTMGEPEELTIGGNPAALVTASDDTADTLVIIVEVEGGYVLVAGATGLGEMADARPTFEAIAGAVVYTPAESE